MEELGVFEHEEELRKMNHELEQRTRKWMKEITEAVNGNDDLESWISDVPNGKELDRLTESLFLDDNSSVLSVKRKTTRKVKQKENEILPDATRGLSGESTIRFLRAKVSLLQNQLISLQHQLTTTTEDFRKAETDLKQSEDDRTKNSQELLLIRERLRKHEQLVADFKEKNNLKQKEYNLLKKENELMKRDTKKAMCTATAYEVKLNRAKEEIDRLKLNLKVSQNGEREAREEGRVKNEELALTIRKLDKQKSELISAFKKQLNLIENLKKQKTLIQGSRVLKYSDDEFLKILDWTSQDSSQSQ